MLLRSQMRIPGLQKMHEGALKICCMCWSQDLKSWILVRVNQTPLITHLSIFFSFSSTNAKRLFGGHSHSLCKMAIAGTQIVVVHKRPLLWIY